jgi:hypothetical protein
MSLLAGRGRSTKIAIGLLLAGALAGCTQTTGGTIGADGPRDDATAAVDGERLCDWSQKTEYNDPATSSVPYARISVSCSSSRQVYTTCNVDLYLRTGHKNDRTHGTQRCTAEARGGPWQRALGSVGHLWLRLDNPNRVWRRGFRGGDEIDCDIYENGNGQSILDCLTFHGAVPSVASQASGVAE